ncbi:MAG: copper homeostasis protein CutC [Melioribacteraceae bacterium]|nr:copper homeostasis protein CutC [Melioribacteraceae bacterium]
MTKKLEICCYTVESAIEAEKAGADRIELCDNYSEGGTTPSYGAIKYCTEKLSIPVNVIVRPRGGDFLYSHEEFKIIKHDVELIKELGANGVVIGFLQSDGEIDLDSTREIVELAYPVEVTFHRAFDMCKDPLAALEQLKDLGIKRILTSGAKNRALDGADLLSKLVRKAEDKIIIMPGSGVNENNLSGLIEKTGAKEFHSSAKTFKSSQMEYFNNDIYMGGNSDIDEFKTIFADAGKIKKMAAILSDYKSLS